MPDWTKKNFDDLRDVSPKDVQIQWRFARDALRSPELGVSRFTYEPGARMPWGHRHGEQEEVYVVVAGSGRAKLDDERGSCGGALVRGRPRGSRRDLHRWPETERRRRREGRRLLGLEVVSGQRVAGRG